MLFVNSEKIQGNVIKNAFPEIMDSVNTSITDDSKDVVQDSVNKIKSANKKLEKSMQDLNEYMVNIADTFNEMDRAMSDDIHLK